MINYYGKAAIVGLLGSLIMFVLMMLAMNVLNVAPFNVPPSAAFLAKLGLNVGPLPLLAHFGYGVFWSVVFVWLFQERMTWVRGLGLAGALWLVMMLVYSPIIGWGPFGLGNASTLPADAPLHLDAGPAYAVSTLVLHAVYGLTIGVLNPRWLAHRPEVAEAKA
jgi:hypothetical protein